MKFLLQLLAATCFLLLLRFTGYLSPNLYIPFWNTYVPVSEPLYFIFAAFVIVGTVNAVNITDGVDGLAAGTCVPCSSASRPSCSAGAKSICRRAFSPAAWSARCSAS